MANKKIPIRYYLVALLLIVILFLGRNTENKVEQPASNKNNSVNQITSYSIKSPEKSLIISNLFSANKNEGYKVIFDVDARDIESINGKSSEKKSDVEKEKNVFNLFLLSDYQDRQLVGTFEVILGENNFNKEFNFVTDNKYNSFLLEKEKIVSNYKITFENIRLSRLNISSVSDLQNLAPTIIGQTDFSQTIASNLPTDLNEAYRLTRTNQKIGQIFMATEDMISQADFKLRFIGGGGNGSYYLELLEVENSNGQMKLSNSRLAYYCFNQDQAEQLYDEKNEVYHFPLGTRLEKGKEYFVGFSNIGVEFSYFNTLEILGSKNSSQTDGKVISSINGQVHQYNAALYYQLYGAIYQTYNDEKVLTGATVSDLGRGEGSYSYKSRGKPSDFLDISSQTGSESGKDVFYDNVTRGVSGNAKENVSFVYDFNTIYGFTRAKITLTQPGGEFVESEPYYSLDGVHWLVINPVKKGGASTGVFEQVVTGNGTNHKIYLKIKCSNENINRKKIKLFGINYLSIEADLIIKK